jgi:hypothetical protein
MPMPPLLLLLLLLRLQIRLLHMLRLASDLALPCCPAGEAAAQGPLSC